MSGTMSRVNLAGMVRSRNVLRCLFVAATSTLMVGVASAARPSYPASAQRPVVDRMHGEEIVDPYRWLEQGSDPTVADWTEQQNALTRAQLDQFAQTRGALERRFKALYNVTSVGTPTLVGKDASDGLKYFFSRRDPRANHAKIFVRDGRATGRAKLVLDPNTFSEDGTTALDWYYPSPDGSLIAFGKSEGGSELSTLYLLDVETGTQLSLEIPRTRACSVAWDPDSAGFLYTRYPAKGDVPAGEEVFHRHVYHHRFGTDWRADPRISDDDARKEAWRATAQASDDRYQFVITYPDNTQTDVWLRTTSGAEATELTPVSVGVGAIHAFDIDRGKMFIRTNHAAPRNRVMVADPEKPGIEHWRELIPQQKGVISSMVLAGDFIALHVSEDVTSRLRLYDRDGQFVREVTLPTLGTVGGLSGRPDFNKLYFSFSSFAYPSTIFEYHLENDELRVIERNEVPAKTDDIVTKQVWFDSADGTRVPMFVVHKSNVALDGNNPTFLSGYGGFNISRRPGFSAGLIPWLERGGVYAVANIRGGGEFGKQWHEGGRREKRQRSFEDFIAAAEALIENGYTNSDRLVVSGGSNGGLLVGAFFTQRPELAKAVICAVPLLDMLRYHLPEIGRLWIPEFGDPDNAEDFAFIREYSPYHNVRAGTKYPAILFTAGANDTRVDPMHARKMTALMQQATGSTNPILLWVEGKSGHGQGAPLDLRIERAIDRWIFAMWQTGMPVE